MSELARILEYRIIKHHTLYNVLPDKIGLTRDQFNSITSDLPFSVISKIGENTTNKFMGVEVEIVEVLDA